MFTCPTCKHATSFFELTHNALRCAKCRSIFAVQKPTALNSQTILRRIVRMQQLKFQFMPVPCDGKLCACFTRADWGATGMAYHDDLEVAVFEASRLALRDLASRKRAHHHVCKEAAEVLPESDVPWDMTPDEVHRRACIKAATVFTEFDPEGGLL